jgi:putative redox protein
MKATVVHAQDGGFVGRADSGHEARMDWSIESGGTGGAGSPMEMVLMALGACSGIDVLTILRKSRTPPEALRIELSADRREAHPRIFTKIHLEYIVRGAGIKPAALERAIRLSEETYCSVAGMLRGSVEITSGYRIES